MEKYEIGFIAIGDEITDGDITNTNTANFASILSKQDKNIGFHISCRDDENDINKSIDFLIENHTNIITIGGLGPTEDDITTKVVSEYFNRNMTLDNSSWEKLEQIMLNKYGRVPNNTKKQAMFPIGYQIIENHNGTANGFRLEFDKGRFISVFPGPPKECIPMLEDILSKSKIKLDKKIIKKSWDIYGIGESVLAEKLEQIKAKYSFVTFKYRIDSGFIELKYFYPRECPYSKSIITEVEHILASNLNK